MKKMFSNYFSLIGFSLTGIVFAIASFIFFINLYHHENVSSEYKKDSIVEKRIYESNKLLTDAKKNISINVNNSEVDVDRVDLLNFYSKINFCISSFQNTSISNILNKNTVNISDVYDLLLLYQENVLNDCFVVQLYDLSSLSNISSVGINSTFLKNNINALMNDMSYLKKNLENNSSYFMSSSIIKNSVFDYTRDSYIQIINSYELSVNLIYELSNLYRNILEGEV